MGYTQMTEDEYNKLKMMTDTGLSVRTIAGATKRAISTISYIKKSKDFADYKELTHREKKKAPVVKVGKTTEASTNDSKETNDYKLPELERIANALEELVVAWNTTKESGKKKGWLK